MHDMPAALGTMLQDRSTSAACLGCLTEQLRSLAAAAARQVSRPSLCMLPPSLPDRGCAVQAKLSNTRMPATLCLLEGHSRASCACVQPLPSALRTVR